MRHLTFREVQEQYGGVLPSDAIFRPDDDEVPPSPSSTEQAAKPPRRTRSERFATLNAFVDVSLAELTGAEAKVWLILFRDTKADGTARTGQTDLARRAGLSRRGVQVAIGKLIKRGLVSVTRRGRLNGGPSTYRIHPTITVHSQ